MVATIVAGLWLWPDWTQAPIASRAWHLTIIIALAGAVYVAALAASGLRLRDLRAH
jgi:putative peptidoglycan lipid II flippase